jgi:hypothetical protein
MNENERLCSACGSKDLIPDLKIVDHGLLDSKHDLAIEMHGKPNASIFKDTRRCVLRATVCADCGHVDLSVDNPGGLWHIYQRHVNA